jgi:hypothetical protein
MVSWRAFVLGVVVGALIATIAALVLTARSEKVQLDQSEKARLLEIAEVLDVKPDWGEVEHELFCRRMVTGVQMGPVISDLGNLGAYIRWPQWKTNDAVKVRFVDRFLRRRIPVEITLEYDENNAITQVSIVEVSGLDSFPRSTKCR